MASSHECPEYRQTEKILKVRSNEKITYAQAASKVRQNKLSDGDKKIMTVIFRMVRGMVELVGKQELRADTLSNLVLDLVRDLGLAQSDNFEREITSIAQNVEQI